MMYDRPISRHNIWRIHPQLRKSYRYCTTCYRRFPDRRRYGSW